MLCVPAFDMLCCLQSSSNWPSARVGHGMALFGSFADIRAVVTARACVQINRFTSSAEQRTSLAAIR